MARYFHYKIHQVKDCYCSIVHQESNLLCSLFVIKVGIFISTIRRKNLKRLPPVQCIIIVLKNRTGLFVYVLFKSEELVFLFIANFSIRLLKNWSKQLPLHIASKRPLFRPHVFCCLRSKRHHKNILFFHLLMN